MTRRFFRKPPPNLCTDLGPEDGHDPRFDSRDPGRVSNRKALQLCRQVERALAVALEGEILRDLTVHSVVPAPDSSRLLITFHCHGNLAIPDILAALHARQPHLRNVIAAAIHRKKTPELTFRILREPPTEFREPPA